MKFNLKNKYFGIAVLMSLLICVTINMPFILSAFFEGGDAHHIRNINIPLSLAEMGMSFLAAFLIFTLNFYLVKPYDKYHKLNFKSILITILLSFLAVFLLVIIFNLLKDYVGLEENTLKHHDELLPKQFFGTALVLGTIFLIRLINQKQTFELENVQLRTESLQSQYESLKNQVSPHFLFNSLTALKTLIDEAPDIAKTYVDNLSQVLRYTLQSNEKQLVTLGEEMNFSSSYIFLIKMRYDANLDIITKVDEKLMNMLLPPLTIQTLLENAVKHNEISKRNPLVIHVDTTDHESLTVKNKIQEKLRPENGTGIGLSNLSKQYQLLGTKSVQIYRDESSFSVEVPLLKP